MPHPALSGPQSGPQATPHPGETALALYRQRALAGQNRLRTHPDQRQAVEAALRPWAAICCLAGTDLFDLSPDLGEWLATMRTDQRAMGLNGMDERRARALIADELAPRQAWKAALVRARNNALDSSSPEDAASCDHARAVMALTEALGVHTPYQPRTTKLEKAA